MPKLPPTGCEALARYERAVEPLLERGAARGTMFGMPVVKVRDKVFAEQAWAFMLS